MHLSLHITTDEVYLICYIVETTIRIGVELGYIGSVQDKIQTMLKNNCECGLFASTDDSMI